MQMGEKAKRTHIFARHVAAVFGAAAIVLGALGLCGWLFDVPLLRTVSSGFSSMKANTAIGLVLAGAALMAAALRPAAHGPWQTVRIGLAAAVAALGFAVMVQYLFRIDLGIDQLLFRDPFTPVEFHPGRVSRANATGMVVFGFAMLLTFRRPNWSFWTGFALTAVGFWSALFVCVGYMFNAQALYASTWFDSISVHTGLAFLLLFAGMMHAEPERGWARIVLSDKLGGVAARRVLPLIAVVPLGILWLANQGARAGLYSEKVSEFIATVALLIVLTALAIVMSGRLNVTDAQRRALERAREEARAEAIRMRHMAEVDGLTGLWNRRHFMAAAADEIVYARANGLPLTVLMIDIDHFKRINDTHGHSGGDKALKLLAATLNDYTRQADCVGRLGGEEFAVLLPGAGRAVAHGIAERFREQVARLAVLDGRGASFGFTVSVGLGELSPEDERVEDLLARADAALYEAKRGGRNRVIDANPPDRSAA